MLCTIYLGSNPFQNSAVTDAHPQCCSCLALGLHAALFPGAVARDKAL